MADSQPSLIQDQARTGTFGGAQLDGTIKEGYQLNAFETPEEEEAADKVSGQAATEPPADNIPVPTVQPLVDPDFLPADADV